MYSSQRNIRIERQFNKRTSPFNSGYRSGTLQVTNQPLHTHTLLLNNKGDTMSIILIMLGYTIIAIILLTIVIMASLALLTWLETKGYYNP